MNNKYVIIVDGLGVGKAPDSRALKSDGANTLKLLNSTQRLKIPNLKHLGIGLIKNAEGLGYEFFPIGIYGKAFSQIKSKNRYSLMQELLQVELSDIPSYNPTGNLSNDFIKAVETETQEKFLINKNVDLVEAIKEYNNKHLKTKKCMLFTTGKSDLILAGNTNVVLFEKITKLFDSIVSLKNKLTKFRFAEYHLILYKEQFDSNRYILNRKLSRHVYSPQPIKEQKLLFIGPDFDKIVLSKNIIKTKNDIDTYRKVSGEIKKNELKDTKFIINFNQLYCRLLQKDIDGALNAINLIDLYIGEIMKNLDETDELLIIGTCGCDMSILPKFPTKEAIPFIYFRSNCSSKNFGTLNLSEILSYEYII